ncbi:LuxR C-terminal-related transcriptional regulator [Mycobacterium camsae]|uniref:LuxR C-terminal-related transcriptional regulator n=1 Tax=Mycobacterium gordonae TaxID=1778 RepID=UPI00197EBB23|nr:LuxR C-terminal-related transcriptional regulator [Mycobacterium gordonae]
MSTATYAVPDVSGSWPARDDRVLDFRAIRPLRVPDGEEWSLVGEPLRDQALRDRVVSVLHKVATLPGFDNVDALDDDRNFTSIQAALKSAYDRLAEVTTTNSTMIALVGSRLALLTEIGHLQLEVAHAQGRQKHDRYAATRSALSRLHGVDSIEQMLERAPAELCRCGFDRAIVSRVEESTWRVESVHVKADAEWASEIARVGRANPMHIDHMLIESEIMRRRAPVLVRDAQNDRRTNAAIGQASLSRSYVAAPIMPDGRIIGLLHADCYVSRRHVDDEDLAVLWMFAEAFGYAFQRTALSERLRAARSEIQRMVRGIATAADDLCTARTELGHPQPQADGAATPPPIAASLAANSSIESLLSRREIEVVALMSQGKSNGAIATHLVISEGTVKTHVKHILRKLKASNRAEAVFRYMRMTAVHGSVPPVQGRLSAVPR